MILVSGDDSGDAIKEQISTAQFRAIFCEVSSRLVTEAFLSESFWGVSGTFSSDQASSSHAVVLIMAFLLLSHVSSDGLFRELPRQTTRAIVIRYLTGYSYRCLHS